MLLIPTDDADKHLVRWRRELSLRERNFVAKERPLDAAESRILMWLRVRNRLRRSDSPFANQEIAILTTKLHASLRALARTRAEGGRFRCRDAALDRLISTLATKLRPAKPQVETLESLGDITADNDPAREPSDYDGDQNA